MNSIHLLHGISNHALTIKRSSPPKLFLGKGVLKTCNKLTREHPYGGVISIKLLCSFIKIALRHGCSPVNVLHIFRTPLEDWLCKRIVTKLINYFPPKTVFWQIQGEQKLNNLPCDSHNPLSPWAKVTLQHNCKPTIYLKRDSNTGVFLWIMINSSEHLFERTIQATESRTS